jgi:hypothetical protein
MSALEIARPTRKPCACPICVISRSLDALHDATDTWVEREGELEMAHAYLRDEVEAVLGSRLSLGVRRRLRRALEISRPTPQITQETEG